MQERKNDGSPDGRNVPDIGAVGDPQTGFLVGQTQTFPGGAAYDEYRIGGTSLSSPLMAGIMALADQAAGHPHGFANPLFYAHAGAFYDVRSIKTAVARRNSAAVARWPRISLSSSSPEAKILA